MPLPDWRARGPVRCLSSTLPLVAQPTMQEDSKKAAEEIKVSDRRSFTATGERRSPDQPKSEPPRATLPASPSAASAEQEAGGPGAIDFDSFVRYLAQVAFHQMTAARESATGEGEAGLEEAKQTIEIMVMLKSKTRGNLTPREERSLDDLLYQLRIEFSRRAAAPKR
jgi:hypothetical protein